MMTSRRQSILPQKGVVPSDHYLVHQLPILVGSIAIQPCSLVYSWQIIATEGNSLTESHTVQLWDVRPLRALELE